MYKITDYQIVSADNVPELERRVKKAIKDGWQPFGNLLMDIDCVDSYVQPMVKHEGS